MEKHVNQSAASGSESLILQLHGIDKEWVRSSSGEWVDLASLQQAEPEVEQSNDIFEEPVMGRKWWKFWG